jgi:hypothetical protein
MSNQSKADIFGITSIVLFIMAILAAIISIWNPSTMIFNIGLTLVLLFIIFILIAVILESHE